MSNPTPYSTYKRPEIKPILLTKQTVAHLFKLPDNIYTYLLNRIKIAEDNDIDWKDNLAGNISRSLKLEDPENMLIHGMFIDLLHSPENDPFTVELMDKEITEAYKKIFPGHVDTGHNLEPYLSALWANWQYKHEFNPLHNHHGIYSFVIWIDIPYSHYDERKLDIARGSINDYIGNFVFTYADGRGISNEVIPMTPNMNGWGCFFPSELSHHVYPFYTSDKPRISISGNVQFMETVVDDDNKRFSRQIN